MVIYVYLRTSAVQKTLLLITPKHRLSRRFQRISRIRQSLRDRLLRVHENASGIASRHPRNRAARMRARPGEEQTVDRRFVIRQLRQRTEKYHLIQRHVNVVIISFQRPQTLSQFRRTFHAAADN